MKKFRINKKYIRIIVVTFIITGLYVFYVSDLRPVQSLRYKLTDSFYALKYRLNPPPEEIDKIIVLAIDGESFTKLNMRWPWPRTLIAKAVKKTAACKPRVICIDLNFTEESGDRSQDIILADAFKAAGNVIIASRFTEEGKYVPPNKLLLSSCLSSGFVDKPIDVDKVTRRIRPVALSQEENAVYYSLSLKAACGFWGVPFDSINYEKGRLSIRYGGKSYADISLNKDNAVWANYNARPKDFETIPIWKAVKGDVRPAVLKNKVVFIGIVAEVFHDIYYTPFGIAPGVLMDAEETLMYLSGSFVEEMSLLWQYNIVFLLALIILLSVHLLDIIRAGIVFGLEIIAFLVLGFYLFMNDFMPDFLGGIFVTAATFIGFYVYKNISLLLQNARLRNEALTDGLTKFNTRRFFDLKLKNEFDKALKENRNLALIIIDVDYFKQINDTYGHEQGNVVLTSVADVLRRRSRKHDIIARFAGTSFAVYMADAGFHDALRHAENLRKGVEGLKFIATMGRILKITLSAGVSTLRSFSPKEYSDLIKAADAALYRAKNTGRNKICLFDKNLDIIGE